MTVNRLIVQSLAVVLWCLIPCALSAASASNSAEPQSCPRSDIPPNYFFSEDQFEIQSTNAALFIGARFRCASKRAHSAHETVSHAFFSSWKNQKHPQETIALLIRANHIGVMSGENLAVLLKSSTEFRPRRAANMWFGLC